MNKRWFVVTVLLGTLLAVSSGIANADPHQGWGRHGHRGKKVGWEKQECQLPPGERAWLDREQREFDRMRIEAESDGIVTSFELRMLNRKLDRGSREMFWERYNRRYHDWHGCGMEHCRYYHHPHYHDSGHIFIGFRLG